MSDGVSDGVSAAAYDSAIGAFWRWWAEGGARDTDAAIEAREPDRIADHLATLVAAIDPGLQWELGAGGSTRHTLVVTAAGDPPLRATARAWLRAAPPPDPVWGYADLRQPAADPDGSVLEMGGRRIAFDAFVAAAHRGSTAIDVAVHHPVFMDIAADDAARLAYLALDTHLGEEVVETWLGEVTWPGEPPLDAFPLRFLRGVVTEFADGWRTPDGEPQWVALRGTGPTGSPVLAFAQVPLRQITFPLFDTHIGVTLPYAESTPEGLPGPASLEELRSLEDRLGAALGEDGRIVAHQSHEGVRLLHLYAAAHSPAADRVAAVAADWTEGRAQTIVTHDPGWSLVHHLAG